MAGSLVSDAGLKGVGVEESKLRKRLMAFIYDVGLKIKAKDEGRRPRMLDNRRA